MSSLRARLRCSYLAWFGKPAELRTLFRHERKHRPTRILELGIGAGQRAAKLIEVAAAMSRGGEIRYTGIDLFEMRKPEDGLGMSLKLAHRQLASTGAKVRLVPGDPLTALARTANSLGAHDLVLIAADQDRASLEKAWFYVPRLLDATSTVFEEKVENGVSQWRVVPADEIKRLSSPPPRRQAA
jgi:hypothetical protein